MPPNDEMFEGKKFSKDALRGRHFTTFDDKLNELFLRMCIVDRREPGEMLRIIAEDYFEAKEREKQRLIEITEPPSSQRVRRTPHLGQRPVVPTESDVSKTG